MGEREGREEKEGGREEGQEGKETGGFGQGGGREDIRPMNIV